MLKYFIFFFFILGSFTSLFAETSENQLAKADKLFAQKKFTEAFKLYESILGQEQYSPQMLLKMAFIKEGLADYPSALYFLCLYYRHNSESTVLQKIVEIADKYELKGYDYSDTEYFAALYNQYKWIVCTVVLLLSIYFLNSAWRSASKRTAQSWLLGQVALLAVLALVHNLAVLEAKGVVRSNNVYAMNAPSAAANVFGVLSKGHRLTVLEEHDIWYKVLWEGELAYVRKHHLLIVK